MSRKRKMIEEEPLYINGRFLEDDMTIDNENEEMLRPTLKAMSEMTVYEKIFPQQLCIFSILEETDDALKIAIVNPDYADNRMVLGGQYFNPKNHNVGFMKKETLKSAGISKKLIREIVDAGYYMILRRDNGADITIIPSKAFFATFCRQIGVAKLNTGPDLMRDIYLASRMRSGEQFTLVYRTCPDGFAKAFGAFSPKFGKIPQTVVYDFLDSFSEEEVVIRHWEVTHFVTTVEFAIPALSRRFGRTKVTPGIRLSLSDVGDSSYSLQNALYINGGFVLLEDRAAKRHTSGIDVQELCDEYEVRCLPVLKQTMDDLFDLGKISIPNVRKETCSMLEKTGIFKEYGLKCVSTHMETVTDGCGTKLDAAIEALKIPGTVKHECTSSTLLKASTAIGKIFV